MTSKKFDELFSKLNPEQKKAVEEIEGPVMVVAGPGTGKTQILTLRIANILLQTQVNPENILALTFTESATTEMRKRLADIIGTPAYKVEINTFHGFSNEVIKSNPENFPYLISSENITEVEQIESLEKIISETDLSYLKPFGDQMYYLKPAISEISNLKKEGVSPEDLEEAIKKWEKEFDDIEDLYHEKGKYKGEMKGKYRDLQKDIAKTKELLLLYIKYQEYLLQQKKYDFNDMLLYVKKALEKDKNLLLRIQEKYQYILVDEHQDTNAAQNKIIELVGGFFDNPNIFVVGDEKQAIFRFQGASLENFLYFKKIYPLAKFISLAQNYRSHQIILDASDSLITNNITANLLLPEKVSLRAQKEKMKEPIKLGVLNDYFAEYQFVASDIEKKKSQGIKLSEIVVIGRTNHDLQVAAETLERNNIPYFINSDTDILSDKSIQKLIYILRAIQEVGSERNLLNAMHIDLFEIEPLDIYKLLKYSRGENISLYDCLAGLNKKITKELKLSTDKNITKFYELLKAWQKVSINDNFEQLFIDVINGSGLKEAVLKNSKRYELLDKLVALFEEIKQLVVKNPQFSLEDFLKYLDLCKKHDVSLKNKVRTVNKDSVQLMTAHRSKGLEFDCVYIINVFDGHWGNARKRSAGFKIPWDILGIKLTIEGEENEDERRLFYVAMTRARGDIIMTYSNRSIGGNEQIPSQFLTEIDERLIENMDVSDFEKNFLANKDIILNPKPVSKISGKNKEFFKEIFISRGLSATALDNYLKCPWQFFYRNLLQFPEVKQNYMIFGTCIHYALDSFIKEKNKKNVTADFLLEKFKESLEKEAISKKDKEDLIKKGEKSLKGYFETVIPTWERDVQSELVIKGVKLSDDVIINGRLDMIEIHGQGNTVSVRDFKTGKIKSRGQIDGTNEKSKYNYLQQLTFYKILLDRYKNGLMIMSEGIIDFVEPDEKGRFKSERFEITDQMVKDLEIKIISVSKQILNLEFWDSRCDDKDCEYCKLRDLTMKD